MNDRIVQFPSRYQLLPVNGTTDQFDLVPVPGNVTSTGTNLNKALFDHMLAAWGTTAGTAYTLTLAFADFALADGLPIVFKLHADISGGATLNVNATGAKALVYQNGVAVRASAHLINTWVYAVYSSTLDKYVISGLYVPNTSDIGAVPVSGGNMTGALNFNTWTSISGDNGANAAFGTNFYLDAAGTYRYTASHGSLGARGVVINWANSKMYYFDTGNVATTAGAAFTPTLLPMYHAGNKPTPPEIGAASLGVITTLANANLVSRTPGMYSVRGVDIVGTGLSYYTLFHNVDQADPNYATQMAITCQAGYPTYIFTRNCSSSNTWGGWVRIFSSSDLPTPAQIGAFNKSGDTMTGMLTTCPSVGSIAGSNGSGDRLRVQNSGSDAAFLSFLRNGIYAVNLGLDIDNLLKVGGWSMGATAYKIYHEGAKPTPAELGAVPLTSQWSFLTPGTYQFSVPRTGYYTIEMHGGGGCSADGTSYGATINWTWVNYATKSGGGGGGSGWIWYNVWLMQGIIYTVVVGAGNANAGGNPSYLTTTSPGYPSFGLYGGNPGGPGSTVDYSAGVGGSNGALIGGYTGGGSNIAGYGATGSVVGGGTAPGVAGGTGGNGNWGRGGASNNNAWASGVGHNIGYSGAVFLTLTGV